MSSWYRVLPPSMIVSPGSRSVAELADRALGDLPCRDHHPHRARPLERRDELRRRGRAGHPLVCDGSDGIGVDVGADTAVAVAEQAPDEVRAHAAETDHPELASACPSPSLPPTIDRLQSSESTRAAAITTRGATTMADTLSDSPAWQALRRHHAAVRDLHLRELFATDPGRAGRLTFEAADIHADLSKHRVTDETVALLLALADERSVAARRDAMFRGEHVNTTEDRPALHVALRLPRDRSLVVDGRDVVRDVHEVLDRMRAFSERVRSGEWRGHSGRRIQAVVNIGIGGSDLGPAMALRGAACLQRPRHDLPLRVERRRGRPPRGGARPRPGDDPRRSSARRPSRPSRR